MWLLLNSAFNPAYAMYATTQKTLGYWQQEPIVLICDERIEIKLVQEALNIWDEIGFQSHLRKDPDSIACMEPIDGIITIKVSDDLPYSHSGETHTRHTWVTREVYGADISIRNGRQADLTLITHELGHAFGWGHSDDPDNIMFARISVISSPIYSHSARSILETAVFEEYLSQDKSLPEEYEGLKRWLKRLLTKAE